MEERAEQRAEESMPVDGGAPRTGEAPVTETALQERAAGAIDQEPLADNADSPEASAVADKASAADEAVPVQRIAEFTDDEIAGEEEFLRGLPRVNIGALVMPGIWGPAHGFWVCILFYPLYIFADYMFYGAYAMPEPWTIILAVVTGVLLLWLHIAFARISGPLSAHRADHNGVSRETYLKRERIWAVVSVIIAIAALAWATYYNLDVRTVLK